MNSRVPYLCAHISVNMCSMSRVGKNRNEKKKHSNTSAEIRGPKHGERNPLMGIWKIAEHFSCGKSQIATILNNRHSILKIYESNVSSESIRSRRELAYLSLWRLMKLFTNSTYLLSQETSIFVVLSCVKRPRKLQIVQDFPTLKLQMAG